MEERLDLNDLEYAALNQAIDESKDLRRMEKLYKDALFRCEKYEAILKNKLKQLDGYAMAVSYLNGVVQYGIKSDEESGIYIPE
jgi:hypothetical protein